MAEKISFDPTRMSKEFVLEFGLLIPCPKCGKSMQFSLHEDDFVHYAHPDDSNCRIRTIIVYAGD